VQRSASINEDAKDGNDTTDNDENIMAVTHSKTGCIIDRSNISDNVRDKEYSGRTLSELEKGEEWQKGILQPSHEKVCLL
jgi:hypothetical protein